MKKKWKKTKPTKERNKKMKEIFKGVENMDWDTMIMYYNYYDECLFEGKEPKNFWDWYYEGE